MLFTAALRKLSRVCVCDGGTGYVDDALYGDVPGLLNPDAAADDFIKNVGDGLNKENTGNATPVKTKDTDTFLPPPLTAYAVRLNKQGLKRAERRQRHLPKTALKKTPETFGGKRVTDKGPHDSKTLNRILSDFHKWANKTPNATNKDVEDLKEDLKRADKRAAGYKTDKNLAVAETNKKKLVVKSLKKQLSKKTLLVEDEKDKYDKFYDNARRVQDEIRAHGQNHLSAFRQEVEKSVNAILDAAVALYRDLDDKLDELTEDNQTAHPKKRPSGKLLSESPPPNLR